MKKATKIFHDPDMREEYDFRGGVRGKYAKKFGRIVKVAVLEPDVAEAFPTSGAVNEALRALLPILRRNSKKKSA